MSLEKCKSILVAVDFSPPSLVAARDAIAMGGMLKADVTLLHVVHDPEDAPGYYHRTRKGARKRSAFISDAARQMMDEFIKESDLDKAAKGAGVKLDSSCVVGLPSATIIGEAEKKKYCLVVIGSRGQTGLKRILIGSVAERVVQGAKVPVLVVKGS